MFELISSALIWIVSFFLDRRPHGGEALRLVLLIIFTVVATWLSLYWRELAYRSPRIRRSLLPEERYAGRYLQAIWRDSAVRYAVVNIFYNRERRRFELAGRSYNPEGKELSSFRAPFVLFPSGRDYHIEFIWEGGEKASGCTRMTVDHTDEELIQGHGLVVIVDAEPKAYSMRFKHLQERHVKEALGISCPAQASEEPEFIRKFHALFGGAVLDAFAASREVAVEV